MNLRMFLPFQIFAEKAGVLRIVVETSEGSLGILPHRLDCVAALVPGILTYYVDGECPAYVAVDEGVIVKEGLDVRVSVRHAIAGMDLGQLHESVKQEFLKINKQESDVRAAVARMEGGLIRRVAEFQHER
jgi:F-type H+-transporting ATPase subunit epsilon